VRHLALRLPTLFACIAALALLPTPARAAQTIVVSAAGDTTDPTQNDGVCDAPCTLRRAIQTANGTGSPGLDIIDLTTVAGPVNLAIAGAAEGTTPNDAIGDLDITQDLTITGPGQGALTIDGKGKDRIFDIAPGATSTISGVTITGGEAKDGIFTTAGGAIRVGRADLNPAPPPNAVFGAASALTLSDSTLTGNSAQDGAGIATDAINANLTMNRVTVSNNVFSGGPGNTEGGGVNERFGGTVNINDSTVTNNAADSGGGVTDDGAGTINITDSLVSNNRGSSPASQGAGVEETGGGNVTLTRTRVTGNTNAEGGGVVEDGGGSVTIIDSTIDQNSACGAQFPDGGGVLGDAGGPVTIRGSTIAGNTASRGAGVADLSGSSRWDISNTTISGNHATTTCPAVGLSLPPGTGGGILSFGGTTPPRIDLNNVTLHDNVSDAAGAGDEIYNCTPGVTGCGSKSATVNVRNTIVGSAGVNCSGPITSGGSNIDSTNTCGFGAAGDKVNTDPLLGALAANGGLTATHAELDGSPAIDAGDPATCTPADQRGVPRPVGGACDIGAFERGPAAPASVDPTPSPTPTPPQQPPAPGPTTPSCAERTKPRSSVSDQTRVFTRTLLSLSGRTTDRDCRPDGTDVRAQRPLRTIQVSVRVTVKGGTCEFVQSNGKLSAPRACTKPIWLRAKAGKFSGGKTAWGFSLRVSLPPGRYLAIVRSADSQGNVETAVRRTNQAPFRVR
jgi:hypothetical protein